MAEPSKAVQIALTIADEFATSADAAALKKALPVLAVKLDRAGEDVTEDILRSHANQGAEHVQNVIQIFKNATQTPKLTYESIVARLGISHKTTWYDLLNNKKKNPLLFYVRKGELQEVINAHKAGRNIREKQDLPMRLAAEHGHLEILKYLHQNGANIRNEKNYAVRHAGTLEILKYCVENGADITAGNHCVIRRAVDADNLDMAQYAIENGVDITTLSNKQKKRYELAKQHAKKWQKLFNINPPQGLITSEAPPEHFKPKAFAAAQKWLSKEIHNVQEVNIYAYKLSALFMTEDRILRYLDKWGQQERRAPLHDLADKIKIPATGNPDLKAWGDATLRFGPQMAKLVKFGDRLEKPKATLDQTRTEIAKTAYKRSAENPYISALCFSFLMTEKQFEKTLDFYQKHKQIGFKPKKIPDITIDGERFGKPGYKFYRLPAGDPRGLVLGEYTDCCQSIHGVGWQCAQHGFSSENSGFYVIENPKGEIIGQTWAWLGENNELGFDSLEKLGQQLKTENWQAILEEVRSELATDSPKINGLYVGRGGDTPENLAFKDVTKPIKPKGYNGYRDSLQQYQVWDGKPLPQPTIKPANVPQTLAL